MTAEVADGWMPLFYLPEKAKEVWGADLDAGLAKRDPELGPLQIAAGGVVAIGDDVDRLPRVRPADDRPLRRRHGRQGPATSTTTSCRRYGFEQEAEEIQDLYLDGHKDEAAAMVPDDAARGDLAVRPRGLREGAHRRLPRGRASPTSTSRPIPIGDQTPAEVVTRSRSGRADPLELDAAGR